VAAVPLVSVHAVRAEDLAGSVQGVVKSASGQALPGAYVKLINAQKRLTFMAVTQAQGRYTMANLPAGDYTVQGIGNGFQSKPMSVALTAGKPAVTDISLTDTQGPVVANGWVRTPGRVAGNELFRAGAAETARRARQGDCGSQVQPMPFPAPLNPREMDPQELGAKDHLDARTHP